MIRQVVLNQLVKTTLPWFAKPASTPSTQGCNAVAVIQSSTKHNLEGPIRNICVSYNLQKYNRKSGAQDVDTDSEDETEQEFKDERDSKVIKKNVNSLRTDLILKAGLGVARNKIENMFYEGRLRVNGKKLTKKSVQLNEGDEIDAIRGFSQQTTSFLVVSRVIILSASERDDGYSVNLRRYKSLLIENYSGANAFKSSSIASDQ